MIQEINLNPLEKLQLFIHGKVKIMDSRLNLYAFECRKHGIVTARPSGHKKRLLCPKCIEELKNDP
jgi:hypothetical protein